MEGGCRGRWWEEGGAEAGGGEGGEGGEEGGEEEHCCCCCCCFGLWGGRWWKLVLAPSLRRNRSVDLAYSVQVGLIVWVLDIGGGRKQQGESGDYCSCGGDM